MAYTPQILTSTDDYKAIQGHAGADVGELSSDFPFATILTSAFLGQAEAEVSARVAAQSANGVPTVAQILAGTSPATATDLVRLKNAVIYLVVSYFTPGSTNAINVSVQTGEQNVDRGGIGTQWKDQKEDALSMADRALTSITNWQVWRTL